MQMLRTRFIPFDNIDFYRYKHSGTRIGDRNNRSFYPLFFFLWAQAYLLLFLASGIAIPPTEFPRVITIRYPNAFGDHDLATVK